MELSNIMELMRVLLYMNDWIVTILLCPEIIHENMSTPEQCLQTGLELECQLD